MAALSRLYSLTHQRIVNKENNQEVINYQTYLTGVHFLIAATARTYRDGEPANK